LATNSQLNKQRQDNNRILLFGIWSSSQLKNRNEGLQPVKLTIQNRHIRKTIIPGYWFGRFSQQLKSCLLQIFDLTELNNIFPGWQPSNSNQQKQLRVLM
jgi:hypothetical protein